MAGHNKWSKIKHRKAVVDKRRGKVWTKIAKTIIVAAKNGGGDPDSNLALRYAIDEARYANMPRDTIERAIKKGAGGGDTSNYETIRYEGYGPGGVAIIVDALTDNRTRTITDVRTAFSKYDGNVGASGCVAYMFQHLGRIAIDAKGVDEEHLMEVAVEAGATDVLPPDEQGQSNAGDDEPATWTVITPAQTFQEAKSRLSAAKLTITDAQLAMVPDTTTALSGDAASDLESLVEMLEDLDDVQAVYTNAE